ncbi:MAG TPA: IS110 family transposase [Steroidobacteraceae bacterium]
MDELITGFVGLDAHAESTAIGFAEAGREAPRFVGMVGPKPAELKKALGKLGEPQRLLIVYEAGPCGYTLARELTAQGYRCEVVAPSRIPRRPGERVKTDRRDALNLASLARAGELVAVTIPDERDEAIRDLSRARVDAVRARLKTRQQLKALMLRHGRRYTGKSSWTAAHQRYLATVSFAHPAQDIAYEEYRQGVSEGEARVQRLSQALAQEVERWRMQPVVYALMTLRGLDLVAATTVVAELGDLKRFAHPRELMAYLGLVPSEHTSGSKRRLGAITKTGNTHVRRVLIEAAWNYRFPARVSHALQVRQESQPPIIRAIAWRAQLRLSHRYRRLKARRLQHNKICVALARELAGFVWDIARHVGPSA